MRAIALTNGGSMRDAATGRFELRPVEDRFLEKVKEPFDIHNGCWFWTGHKNHNGYGRMRSGEGRNIFAHRLSYELFVGSIPEELHIDHICQNRACVRSDHLQAIPLAENIGKLRRSNTHCRYGHLYSEANTYWYKGSRVCRKCAAETQRRYRRRVK